MTTYQAIIQMGLVVVTIDGEEIGRFEFNGDPIREIHGINADHLVAISDHIVCELEAILENGDEDTNFYNGICFEIPIMEAN